ncbi:MAG: orotate phosphoribosyltransferase [Actinomycetota bacterium]
MRQQLVEMMLEFGYKRSDTPFRLASGRLSHDYVDAKAGIARGSRLQIVGEAIKELADRRGVEFDAIGGLTMGADPVALSVAIACDKAWFTVRKEPKEHGRQRRIEGTELGPGTRVLLVDDVITLGGSILEALDVILESGAEVVLSTALVDRGDVGKSLFEQRGVAYEPLLTYADLGIDPVS